MARLKFRKARTLIVKKQSATGKTNRDADKRHIALKPGLRYSKNGTLYQETRANRSDINPKKKL